MKTSIRLLLVVFLLSVAMGKEYYGNITCDKCTKLKCDTEECFYWNGGPLPHVETSCYDYDPATCMNLVLPFKVFECSQCGGSCCIDISGQRTQCVDKNYSQYICVFKNEEHSLRHVEPEIIANIDMFARPIE